jgi:ubiquinone/menaquinone biosynthesis C-methylase UbiE
MLAVDPMGLYTDQILPRVMPFALGSKKHMELRRLTTEGLGGDIVEIGFGAGLNLSVLPDTVRTVHAVDPDGTGRRLAKKRIEASPAEVSFTGLDGEQIPLDARSVDAALSTWTLCTIPRAERALGELRRVLKPGGRYHFLEHGLSTDAGVARWQKRLNPIQGFVAGGCKLDVPIERAIREAGFELAELETFYTVGPKFMAFMYRGVAVNPG